jgi:DNA-binding transcriptional ArsR family regulator
MATCPDSGRPFQLGTANPTGGSEAQRLSYIQLDVSGGTLAGGGSALAWVAGGPAIRAAVAGHLRLPDAELQGACPSGPCPNPNGRTFQADGNLTLSDLALNNDHVRGGLSGQFTSAFFDESPAPGFGGVAAAAAAAVVAVGIGFGLRYLWTAFARSARPPVLEDASRKKIHDTIREHPGFSFSELRRHLGWSTGRLEYHLGFLVEAGLVVRHRDGKAVRFFENHGKYDDTWRHVAPLREDDARRLHDWLLKTPGLDQTRIAETTAAWGWTRARTLRRLARLEEGGLLSAKRDGKRLRYTAIRAPV